MPVIEHAVGALRQVNTDAKTLVLDDVSGSQKSYGYRLELADLDFRRLVGRYVRCVVEDGVVVELTGRGRRGWRSRAWPFGPQPGRGPWAPGPGRGFGRWGGTRA